MNWKSEAINDLKNYMRRKESLTNIPEKITALKYRYTSIKSASSGATPVQGGLSRVEDSMLDNIVERQKLENNFRAVKKLVDLVERGLNGLDQHERLVLERFYINKCRGHVESLMEDLNFEQARVYQIKDEALYKFTIVMYGIIDY